MRYYRCRHFKLYELVDPYTYRKFGRLSWKFLDPDVLEALDILRDIFGPLTVNDWYWGGKFKWSGLRRHVAGFSDWSAHSRGCAFDPKSKRYSGYEMWRILRKRNFPGGMSIREFLNLVDRLFTLINEIETGTPTWLHIAKTNRKKLRWIPKPK